MTGSADRSGKIGLPTSLMGTAGPKLVPSNLRAAIWVAAPPLVRTIEVSATPAGPPARRISSAGPSCVGPLQLDELFGSGPVWRLYAE